MVRNKTVFFHVSNSFEESDKVMTDYYASLTPEERLDIGQYLREQYYKVKNTTPEKMDKNLVLVKEMRIEKDNRSV